MEALQALENFIIELSPVSVLITLLVVLIALTLFVLITQLRNGTRLQGLTFPVYDYVVKEAKHKADGILEEANKKSQLLVEEAEQKTREISERAQVEAREHTEVEKQKSEQLTTAYEKRLSELAQKNEELFERYGGKLEEQYARLASSVGEQTLKSEKAMGEAITVLAQKLEASQTELHNTLTKEISTHLTKAFSNAEESIQKYRTERLKLIDDKIVALVERAAGVALQKKLSLKEHTGFIYTALEEAKQEGLFS